MVYKLILNDQAKQDLKVHAKSGNKKALLKIYALFEEIANHPYTGTGKPEQLTGNLADHWSGRINQKDRLIYQVRESIVTVSVISAKGHYGDK